MGIFRPFIGGVKTQEEFAYEDHRNDKPVTPADLLTISRPILAAQAAAMLIRGEKGAFPLFAIAAATDMEGKLARLIDKCLPGMGYGATEHGAPWDTYADASALLIIGAATMRAPRVNLAGKAAMGMILGQEGLKAGWALYRNAQYSEVSGERLSLPASAAGKEAMAEKLAGAGLAVAINDTDNPALRTGLGVGALYFAGSGAIRGEQARREYEPLIDRMMAEAEYHQDRI